MVSYESLGDIRDGRRWWIADFRGIGRSQVLFLNASDRNWWIGTFDGGAQAITWAVAGHTSFFGDLVGDQKFWTGRFSRADRDQVLFYSPGDQNWWLGTFDDDLGRFRWVSAGNSSGFGNLLGGHKFWRGRFSRGDRDQILFFFPGDENWWLGSIERGSALTWSKAGHTGFGDLQAGQMFWIGRFSGSDRDDVLFYHPGDQNWWLGSYRGAGAELTWSSAGNTSGFGNLLAAHMFWTGRFSRSDRPEVLLYYPGDQNWWLGSHDATTGKLQWSPAGNSGGFGSLLAGHKFWSGPFARTDRDDVLFYYPGDQQWWLGSYGAGGELVWKNVAQTGDLGDIPAAETGSFSRSDRSELLVQDRDRHRWWLASVNDDNGTFWWRIATNTSQPRGGAASEALRNRIRAAYGPSLPGCVFYVTRNGRPFADGSFGHARSRGHLGDDELAMTPSSIVHVGSVTKFLCAVAILRLIEEWNEVLSRPVRANEPLFDRTARAFGGTIDLDQPVYPLLESFLGSGVTPGLNVSTITLRELLDHTSGLPRLGVEITREAFAQAAGAARMEDILFEPGDESPTRFDLRTFVRTLLRQDATRPAKDEYNNDAYAVLTAVIEATTGRPYAAWVHEKLFSDPRFHDIAPRVTDRVRAARYYRFDGRVFRGGNHHPDYTDFSLAGGYYVSAGALAEWVEAVMRKQPVGHGRPILKQPELLLSDRPGVERYAVERFRGFEKNGAASPGGGATNARVAFVQGYGDERIFAFVEANANVNANAVLDMGLLAIAEPLSRRPGRKPSTAVSNGLHQTVFWDDGGTVAFAVTNVAVDIAPIDAGGITADRTLLLGSGSLAGNKGRNEVLTVELKGSLKAADAGQYVFRLTSDDGSFLWLQDELIADNGGDHGMRVCESGGVWLEAEAWYPIRVRWYNSRGGGEVCLEWRAPGTSAFAPVPKENFMPEA